MPADLHSRYLKANIVCSSSAELFLILGHGSCVVPEQLDSSLRRRLAWLKPG